MRLRSRFVRGRVSPIASGPTAPVVVPINSALPIISGTTTQGQTLTVSNGSWNNGPTGFTFQWQRGGANISGAVASSYLLVSGDIATTITCVVTASNAAGSTPATSVGVGPIVSAAPTNSTAPVISGVATQGNTLTVADGTWANSPTSFARQWKRDGVSISSATGITYVLVLADVGTNITCSVTASNTFGSASATSNSFGPIVPAAGLTAPVLTQTSTAGTNPPTWDAVMADLQDGDTIQLDYTTNGSTPDGVAEASHVIDSREETVNWGSAWPNPFPGGVTIKWRERYGRDPGTGFVWSPWSNTLTGAMPASGSVFVPGTAPAGQTGSSTTHTFTSVAFGAGIPIVGVAAFFVSSVTLTPSGGGSPISLTLRADVDASRRDATLWGHTTSIAAGNYDVAVGHSAANNDCSIHPGTLTGATAAPTGTFGQAAGVSSVSYAGAATVPTSGLWIAIAHSYASSPSMNWANGTPTKDSEIATTGSTGSLAHGTSSGTVTCTPAPGGFGAMAGATFGP